MSNRAEDLINSLFEMPSDKPAQSIPVEKPKNRLEFYDNGPEPEKGKTQFGLVLDRNKSAERWNFNSHLITLADIGAMYEDPNTTLAQQDNLGAMFAFIYDNGYHEDANVHLMLAKKNDEAGTGKHNLRSGKRGFDKLAGAVLVDYVNAMPTVYLFLNGTRFDFPSREWESTPQSSSDVKRGQVRF